MGKSMKIKFILPLSCALMIFILEGIALFKGVDGKCVALTCAIIGGLGGYGAKEIIQILRLRK